MLAQLNIIQDQRGYTVSVSTTHQTHARALAHFTELLADFTRDHYHAAAIRAAHAAAAVGDTPPTTAPDLPHRWEGPGHNGQPIEPAPATVPCLVATTAEADERAAPENTAQQLHREIFRARDHQFYTRAELPEGGMTMAGPFPTPDAALDYLQKTYLVGERFIFDDSGRRSAPAPQS